MDIFEHILSSRNNMNAVLKQRKRLDYLDISKAFLIISVVLCHSPFENAYYLYWFHMPAFFIISGMLYKRGMNIKEQAIKFFVPYAIFSLIDINFNYIMYYHGNFSLSDLIHEIIKYSYGGKATWGVFWFIPVMFVTKVVFDQLNKRLTSKKLAFLCILSYILAHIYSMSFIPSSVTEITENQFVFWNLDAVLITLPYYALGYYITKLNIQRVFKETSTLILSSIGVVAMFILNSSMGIGYYLNIKYSYYKDPIFDILMPVTITIFILSLSYQISKFKCKKLFTIIGANSLVIMYLHKQIATLFMDVFNYGYIMFTIIGVCLPLLMMVLINKSIVSKFLFNGDLTFYRKIKDIKDIEPKDIIIDNK
ncbi:acyltransferase family protein [Clostridium perfringens]|uniref:Acyltransferase family protein n=3 Tax=Clostridium TaxID=1485 RepID=Q0SWG6_CLOPS|nr:acyltransferase family protein [Clostridium perfringens]ABG85777.1 acyltransferase family protein [Clostridium perfringens SM101]MDH5061267.1 Acyltransferase family protein [Clostridium perfringens NCTC 8239]CAG9356912.1 acyltransferase [Clostridium perfringens NCTC 8239]SQB59491.1 acyltransferase [Clostridium perfringens]STB54799.1 acyltransferase [Clostridium perfringens]